MAVVSPSTAESGPAVYSEADLAAGRALLRAGSRSFYLSSLLMPRQTRNAATALYAFCRLADDAIDLHDDAPAALSRLQSQLTRVYSGRPGPQSAERLLAGAVARPHVPRALLDALLEGFAWDIQGRRYESLADLNAYAARVAGSVGVMMTLLMGVRDAEVLARASDLGMAMQLTNIARDVGQDARAGRLYLPLAWLREEGIDPDSWLASPVCSPQLARVIERLLCAADALYARSAPGIARLPAYAQPGIHAARLLYAEIGHDLRRHGHDAIARRAHVSAQRKVALLIAALAASLRRTPVRAAAVPEDARFLLDAVHPQGWTIESQRRAFAGDREPQQSRTEWTLLLFERLGRTS